MTRSQRINRRIKKLAELENRKQENSLITRIKKFGLFLKSLNNLLLDPYPGKEKSGSRFIY